MSRIHTIKPDKEKRYAMFLVRVNSYKNAWPAIFPQQVAEVIKENFLVHLRHKVWVFMTVIKHPTTGDIALVPKNSYRFAIKDGNGWRVPWYPGDQEQDHNPDIHLEP